MYDFDISPKIFSNPTITLFRPKIIQFNSEEDLKIYLVNTMVEKTIEISSEYGTARLAISNGKCLNEIFKNLSKNYQFPPENTEIYATHESYTTGKVKSDITKNLTKAKLDEARFSQFVNTKISFVKALALYNEVLDQFEEDEGFDITILEIDKYGQFAGIIVEGNGIDGDSDAAVQNIINGEKIITISVPTILKSRRIYLVLNDEDETLEELLEGQKPASEFPAKVLLAHPNVHIFYHLAA
jgi:6-phosphogluconolactonase/glucosamine-6-phosphate isomerase/deaminase